MVTAPIIIRHLVLLTVDLGETYPDILVDAISNISGITIVVSGVTQNPL